MAYHRRVLDALPDNITKPSIHARAGEGAHQVQVCISQQLKDLGDQRDALPGVLAGKPATSVQLPQLIRSVPADFACMGFAFSCVSIYHQV